MSENLNLKKVVDADGRQTLRSLFTVQEGEYIVPDHIKNEDQSERRAFNAARVAQIKALMTTGTISMHRKAAEEVRQGKIRMMASVGITSQADITVCLNLGSTDFKNLIAYKQIQKSQAVPASVEAMVEPRVVPVVETRPADKGIAVYAPVSTVSGPTDVILDQAALAVVETMVEEPIEDINALALATPIKVEARTSEVIVYTVDPVVTGPDCVVANTLKAGTSWADTAEEEDKGAVAPCSTVVDNVQSPPLTFAQLKVIKIRKAADDNVDLIVKCISNPELRDQLPSSIERIRSFKQTGNVIPNRRERRNISMYLAEESRVRKKHMKSFAWAEVAGAMSTVSNHNKETEPVDYVEGLYVKGSVKNIAESDLLAPPSIVVEQSSYERIMYGWSNCVVDDAVYENIIEEFLSAQKDEQQAEERIIGEFCDNITSNCQSNQDVASHITLIGQQVQAIYGHLGLVIPYVDNSSIGGMAASLDACVSELCNHLGLDRSTLEIGGAFRPQTGSKSVSSVSSGRSGSRARSLSQGDSASPSPRRSVRSGSRSKTSDFCVETPASSRSAASPGPQSSVAGGSSVSRGVMEMLEMPAVGRSVNIIEKEVFEALKPLPPTSQRAIQRLKGRITKARRELQDDVTITLKERNDKAMQRHDERKLTISESRLNFVEKDVLLSDSLSLMEREMAEYMADAAAQKAGLINQFTIKEFDAKFSRYELDHSSEFALNACDRGTIGMRPQLRKRLLTAAATTCGAGILIAGGYLLVSVLHNEATHEEHLSTITHNEAPKATSEPVSAHNWYNGKEVDEIDLLRVELAEEINGRGTTEDIKNGAHMVLLEMSRDELSKFGNNVDALRHIMNESRFIISCQPIGDDVPNDKKILNVIIE